jgi:cytochrome P450
MVDALRPLVQRIVDEALDVIDGRAAFDVVASLAYPLPATVIGALLGLPPDARERFKEWTVRTSAAFGSPTPDPMLTRAGDEALRDAHSWLDGLIEERRAVPRDDLLSALAAAEAVDDGISRAEALTVSVSMMTAGHETVTFLIASGVLALLQHPDQRARLVERPEEIDRAIEEMLRYEAPSQQNLRVAAHDVMLGGSLIRAGDPVRFVASSANRDPDVFPHPDVFDITRDPNRHLSFGVGPHFCIGATLARMEARLAIQGLLARFPRLRLVERPIQWQPNVINRGVTGLWVEP